MRLELRLIGVVMFAAVALFSPAFAAPLVSTFDNNDEGWTTYSTVDGDVSTIKYSSPFHCIFADDLMIGGTWFFVSPNDWGGDWTGFIGGRIEWNLWMTDFGLNNRFYDEGYPDLTILGSGGEPAARLRARFDKDLSLETWMQFSVDIRPENFIIYPEYSEFSFYEILADVRNIYIRGEYIVGADRAALDNVRVIAPVPEPSTMLMFGIALAGLVGVGRKRV